MTSRLRVVLPGAPAVTDGRIDLVVARGAFGSGEHETTASCLELLEELGDLRGAAVLDVGTGTGILAIAALALGAARAVLADTDPAAVEVARSNVRHNRVAERSTVLHGGACSVTERGFDVVLANIQGDILLEIGRDLVERTAPGGRLVLSGIQWEHNWPVRNRYEGLGCVVEKNLFLDEWSSLLLRRVGRAG